MGANLCCYHYQSKNLPQGEAFLIGEPDSKEFAQKSVININFFLEHREEVLAMKEQVKMIKCLLAA